LVHFLGRSCSSDADFGGGGDTPLTRAWATGKLYAVPQHADAAAMLTKVAIDSRRPFRKWLSLTELSSLSFPVSLRSSGANNECLCSVCRRDGTPEADNGRCCVGIQATTTTHSCTSSNMSIPRKARRYGPTNIMLGWLP
jgi:hypothetical protein